MRYIIREFNNEEKFKYNAGSKARNDADFILRNAGAKEIPVPVMNAKEREKAGQIRSLYYHLTVEKAWEKVLTELRDGDTVIFQFPVKAHTVLLSRVLRKLRQRGIRTVALIHDLEYLRNVNYAQTSKSTGLRLKMEEVSALKEFTRIIAHNESMKRFLTDRLGIDEKKIVVLGIFDYLIPDYDPEVIRYDRLSVNIAGSMDPDKSGYIYKLPAGVQFELYGADYRGSESAFVHYHGKFPPDEIPGKLTGGFGLVWDGTETDTCSGVFGSYLRYNNPHKTSLYLAAGIPVIIWEEAAMAGFVRNERCGIVLSSLNELGKVLKRLTEDEYQEMKMNAETVGKRLREGYYTLRAVNACDWGCREYVCVETNGNGGK